MNWRRVQGVSHLRPEIAPLPNTLSRDRKWMDGWVLTLASCYNPAHSYVSHSFKDTDWSGQFATSRNRFREELSRRFCNSLGWGVVLVWAHSKTAGANRTAGPFERGGLVLRASEHWSGHQWCGVFHTNHGKASVYRSIPVLGLKEKLVSCYLQNERWGRNGVSHESHQSQPSPVLASPRCKWPLKKCLCN